MGFNPIYFEKIALANWEQLLEAYNKVPEYERAQELVAEDIDFFKVYGQIFSEEYFSLGTISNYVDYKQDLRMNLRKSL